MYNNYTGCIQSKVFFKKIYENSKSEITHNS